MKVNGENLDVVEDTKGKIDDLNAANLRKQQEIDMADRQKTILIEIGKKLQLALAQIKALKKKREELTDEQIAVEVKKVSDSIKFPSSGSILSDITRSRLTGLLSNFDKKAFEYIKAGFKGNKLGEKLANTFAQLKQSNRNKIKRTKSDFEKEFSNVAESLDEEMMILARGQSKLVEEMSENSRAIAEIESNAAKTLNEISKLQSAKDEIFAQSRLYRLARFLLRYILRIDALRNKFETFIDKKVQETLSKQYNLPQVDDATSRNPGDVYSDPALARDVNAPGEEAELPVNQAPTEGTVEVAVAVTGVVNQNQDVVTSTPVVMSL